MGLVTLEYIVGMVLDLTIFAKFALGSTNIYMGISLVAIANTFVDMFVNIKLATKGQEKMAIVGIFGGQLFNFLFGFGISCLLKGTLANSKPFHLYSIQNIGIKKGQTLTFGIIILNIILLVWIFFSLLLEK